MLAVFAAIFLVMGVMIYFITLSLRIVTENASKKVNSYFLSKLQEYDDDFVDKLDELEQLQEEKEKLQQEIRILKMDHSAMQPSRFYKPRPVIRDSYIPIARYIDNGFFEDYKLAKTLLVMDKEDIIRTIMQKFPYEGNMKRYETAKAILEKLNFEAIYDLCSISQKEQLQVLNEELNADEADLFEEYAKEVKLDSIKDFKILGFHSWLKEVVNEESPMLVAYLGDQSEDYSYISPYVDCQFDKNVCEGIRIVYQKRLYDYSIYESRRKNEHVY